MAALTPDLFSVQALQALQQAGAIAGKARAPLVASSHLLASILRQKDSDASGVLAALGYDPAAMAKRLADQFGSRQMVMWRSDKGEALSLIHI